MEGYIGLTDYDWYTQLLAQSPDEVNFWRPMNTQTFRRIGTGEPFFFKLKSAHGNWIAGFGIYAGFVPLRVGTAWQMFGEKNGVRSEEEMFARIEHYVRGHGRTMGANHQIGCIILTTPVFFPPSHFVAPPSDWKANIVAGAGRDLTVGEGKRIWAECLQRARDLRGDDDALAYNLSLASSTIEFRERLGRVRLGQGAFRTMVTQAYTGTCAVSGDHTLPALEAAHIQGAADGGRHEIVNGLLLRADIHRLFDQHLVTITPDFDFKVSHRLRDEFANGAIYYALENRELHLPQEEVLRPRREYLDAHRDRFAAA